MITIFKPIAKLNFPTMLALLLCAANVVYAQQPTIVGSVLFPPRNFEVMLGDTVTPSVRIHNDGTGSVSGSKIFFIIRNVVTEVTVYEDSLILPSIASGDSTDLTFAPYTTDPNAIRELGTFNACLIAGDTICEPLFGLRQTGRPFFDPSDGYSKTQPNELSATSIDIPNQTMWVSVGATVVDGEDSTWDPPPPRYPPSGVGPDAFVSPVIRLDRKGFSGNLYSGTGVGDTLTSFPINLGGPLTVFFHFDYMRAGRHHYPLNWDVDTTFGPESTTLNVNNGQVVRAGDSLILEFRDPSQPALNVASNGWNEIAAFDGGRDFEFKRFSAFGGSNSWQITMNGVTKNLTNTPNYLNANFRFRLRLKASNNAQQTSAAVDDADAWYIDNPMLGIPFVPEYEIRWVRVVNPYTKVPLSQAVFPVFMGLGVIDIAHASGLPLQVDIINPSGDTVYSQSVIVSSWDGVDTVIRFPDWDASDQSSNDAGAYTIIGQIPQQNFQNYNTVETYSKFFLNAEVNGNGTEEFALDDAGMEPGIGDGNDIPTLTGLRGVGIGFDNQSGSFAMKFQLVKPDTFFGARVYFGSANAAPDFFRISLYTNSPNLNVPADTLEQPGFASTMLASRGPNWDQFSSYSFPRPIPLAAGTYWVSVSQLGVVNMELGGDISRGGAEVTETDPDQISPDISAIYSPSLPSLLSYGTQWGSDADDNDGNVSTSYAVEATAGSGGWAAMMPNMGWWPTMSGVGLPFTEILQFQFNITNAFTGAGTYMPMIRPMIGSSSTSSVQAITAIPDFALEPNYPNPFDPTSTSTTIAYTLDAQGPTLLTICNVMGDIVKTLVNANMSNGTHFVSWDGRDVNGAVVPAGIYFVLLSAEGHRASQKLIVTE